MFRRDRFISSLVLLAVGAENSSVWAETPGNLDLYRTATQSPDCEDPSSFSSSSSPPSTSWERSLRWRGGGSTAIAAVPYGGTTEAVEEGASVGHPNRRGQHQYFQQHRQMGVGHYSEPQRREHQETVVWRRPEEEDERWEPAADDPSLGHAPSRRRGGSGSGGAPDGSRSSARRAAIDAETVSLALRLTCEMNRRLRCGTADVGRRRRRRRGMIIRAATGRPNGGGARPMPFLHEELLDDDGEEEGRGAAGIGGERDTAGGNGSYESIGAGGGVLPRGHHNHHFDLAASPAAAHLRPPRPRAALRIRRMTPEERRAAETVEPTVFHAARPVDKGVGSRAGARRWGPDLRPFLETLCEALGCGSSSAEGKDSENGHGASSSSVVLALAMVYLDRACSVETDRTNPFFPGGHFAQCPYLSPRTVHRSALTALVLACRALRGEADFADPSVTRRYAEALEESGLSLGVTEEELGMMERHMLGALGVGGMGVEADRLELFLAAWGSTFFRDEARQRQTVASDEPALHMGGLKDAPTEHVSGQSFPGDWAQQQYQ